MAIGVKITRSPLAALPLALAAGSTAYGRPAPDRPWQGPLQECVGPGRPVSSQTEAGSLPSPSSCHFRHHGLPCLLRGHDDPSTWTVFPSPRGQCPSPVPAPQRDPLTPRLPAASSCPFLGACSAPTGHPLTFCQRCLRFPQGQGDGPHSSLRLGSRADGMANRT